MSNRPKDKTVLVVEDERQLQVVLSFKLKRHGFAVLQANNGIEGLRKALEERPDLIMLDMMMPGMDGMKMLKMLRLDVWGKRAPVIVLTNLDEEHEDEIMKLGVKKYLVKSKYSLDKVVALVDETCGT